jgi:hypothetical protein
VFPRKKRRENKEREPSRTTSAAVERTVQSQIKEDSRHGTSSSVLFSRKRNSEEVFKPTKRCIAEKNAKRTLNQHMSLIIQDHKMYASFVDAERTMTA